MTEPHAAGLDDHPVHAATSLPKDALDMTNAGAPRVLEPFGFWPKYSSALWGYGGSESSPDPYYCFHTPYSEFAPGNLLFRAKLVGARATCGELALRVHGWRADGTMDAVLVGGMRIPLEEMDGDPEFTVRVASLPGVLYAFFARYTEPSDLRIDDLILTVEELPDENTDTYANENLPATAFHTAAVQQPSHLTLLSEPTLRVPLSQPMTKSQLDDASFWRELPGELGTIADRWDRWRIAYVWQALVEYGVAAAGANGLIRTDIANPLATLLQKRGALVIEEVAGAAAVKYDFLAEIYRLAPFTDSITFSQHILTSMTALLRGGIGVFVFDAHLGGLPVPVSDAAQDVYIPHEQDIHRAALKIIGHSSDVAQITWPIDRDGPAVPKPAPFGLIVRR